MATLYLDESKAKHYVFIGVLVQDGDAPRLRKRVSALKMPGQRSIHFVKEAESRRRKLIQEISDLEFSAVRFESKERNQKFARERCIREIVRFAAKNDIKSLPFERDESAVSNDEKWLKDEILRTQGIDKLYSRVSFVCYLREKLADCKAKDSLPYYKRIGFNPKTNTLNKPKKSQTRKKTVE